MTVRYSEGVCLPSPMASAHMKILVSLFISCLKKKKKGKIQVLGSRSIK